MPQGGRSGGSRLATLLFTDIVASTEIAERLGDRRWREVLARHHAAVRKELRRFDGRELDTAGDGFFAAFPKPAGAIRAAWAIAESVRALGIEIRAGLHVGESEVFGTKLSGVTVHVAARVMASAGPGEVRVTGVVKELVPGSGFQFEDLGPHTLKGIPGEWHLYSVASVDGAARSLRLEPRQSSERLEQIQAPRVPRGARIPLVGTVSALVVTGIVLAVLLGPGRNSPNAAPTKGPVPPPKGRLVAIDPSTREVLSSLALDFAPGPLAFTEGSVWVLDESGDRVLRVDPVTRQIQSSIAVGKDPVDIAVGASSIWVANHFGRSVSRIDAGTNAVIKTIDLDFLPDRIAAEDDAVWVSDIGILGPKDPFPRSDLATIEPSTGRVLGGARFKTATDCAPFLATARGVGWGATAFGEVWSLPPHGGEPTRFTSSGIGLAGILVDAPRSTIWFGSDGSPGKVVSLDPSTKEFSEPIPVGTTENRIGPGCDPIWLTLGGSYLWVTNADDHTLSVIAIVSRQGVDTVSLQGKPSGLAFGVDRIWVAVDLS